MAKVTVRAIHDVDLVRVLRRLGLYEDVAGGRCRCFACGRRITPEDIGGLFKGRDGKVNFVCSGVRCLVAAAEVTSRMSRG